MATNYDALKLQAEKADPETIKKVMETNFKGDSQAQSLLQSVIDAKLNTKPVTQSDGRTPMTSSGGQSVSEDVQPITDVLSNDKSIKKTSSSGSGPSDTTGMATEPESNYDFKNELLSAIDAYISKLTDANRLAEGRAISNIEAERDVALSGEDAAKREAEQLFLNTVESINEGEFDAQQLAKVSSQRRGIASSQQAEALAQGISREGMGLRFKNEQDRTVRLSNIQDRINAIKNAAQQQITSAGIARQQADVEATARGQELLLNRQFAIEDREDLQDFQRQLQESAQRYGTSEREAGQEFQVDQQTREFEQRLKEIDVNFINVLEKTDVDFRNAFALAAQQNQWAVDRDLVNNAAALERLNISNSHAMEILGLQQAYGFKMQNLNYLQQLSVANMDFERTKQLAQLDEGRQKRIMDYASKKDKDMLEFQIGLNYEANFIEEFGQFETKESIIQDVMEGVDAESKARAKEMWGMLGSAFGWGEYNEETFNELTDERAQELLNKRKDEVDILLDGMGYNNDVTKQRQAYEKLKGVFDYFTGN